MCVNTYYDTDCIPSFFHPFTTYLGEKKMLLTPGCFTNSPRTMDTADVLPAKMLASIMSLPGRCWRDWANTCKAEAENVSEIANYIMLEQRHLRVFG